LSWKYYALGQDQSGYIWSALDAIANIRLTELWTQHVMPTTQFVRDAQNGELPAVSWLVVGSGKSEHPPASVCVGKNWTFAQIGIAAHQAQTMRGPLPITMSLGVLASRDWDRRLVEEILVETDLALYKAKTDGRNCVRLAEPPVLCDIPRTDSVTS